MERGVPVEKFIDQHKELTKHFERRASRKEFPAVRYIIYLNYSVVVTLNPNLIESLLRYGADVLYPKL